MEIEKKRNNLSFCVIYLLSGTLYAMEESPKKYTKWSLAYIVNKSLFQHHSLGEKIDQLVKFINDRKIREPELYAMYRQYVMCGCSECSLPALDGFMLNIRAIHVETRPSIIAAKLQSKIAAVLHNSTILAHESYQDFNKMDLSGIIKKCEEFKTNREFDLFIDSNSIPKNDPEKPVDSMSKAEKKEYYGFEFVKYWTWEKVLERLAEHNESARLTRESIIAASPK